MLIILLKKLILLQINQFHTQKTNIFTFSSWMRMYWFYVIFIFTQKLLTSKLLCWEKLNFLIFKLMSKSVNRVHIAQ